MSKDILIIPGFGEDGTMKPYQKLKAEISNELKGVTIRFYNPQWNYRTTKNWIVDFEASSEIKPNTTIIGFSMGAYIALLLAERHIAQNVILASLSPYFKENIPSIPDESKKFFGKRKIESFLKYSIPKNIQTKNISLLFGDKDWQIAIDQAKILAKKYHGNFNFIENTGHELTDQYIIKIVGQI
jgi:predicted alpha/beta hydrolase family esterase